MVGSGGGSEFEVGVGVVVLKVDEGIGIKRIFTIKSTDFF